MPPSPTSQAAEILAAARRGGAGIAELPEPLRPRTLDEAYAVQDAAAALLGPVGGWKVGAEPDGSVRVAPVPASFVHLQSAAPAFPNGVRLEVELALRLGADLPKSAAPYTTAEVDRAIGAAHVIIEVLGSRFETPDAVSRPSFLADGNGNAAIIIGDEIPDWRSLNLSALTVTLTTAGAILARATRGAALPQVLDLLTALANHAADHGGGLQAGQIIITGARAGPTAAPAGMIQGHVNESFTISLRIREK